jgi:CRISPR-associated Cas5-like protein
MISNPICLRAQGPFACFTMPEFHVERVSCPVIAPSAARAIFRRGQTVFDRPGWLLCSRETCRKKSEHEPCQRSENLL